MSFIQHTLIDTPLVGLEDLQRAAFYVFYAGMNNAIAQIQDYWASRDIKFNALTGRNIPITVLEPIPASNFHEGHKPSLIQGDPSNYPNIAVFATQADPSPENDSFDQIDSWANRLLVEVMVKGDDEETTNRRIQRTTEAAVMCLRRNPTLGSAVFGLRTAPTVIISNIFAVNSPSQGGTGTRYLWQGAQIQFRISKDSVNPSSGPGTFAGASQIDYSQYVDQG